MFFSAWSYHLPVSLGKPGAVLFAEKTEPLITQLDARQRVAVIASLLVIFLLGAFLVFVAIWMARWARRQSRDGERQHTRDLPVDVWSDPLRPGETIPESDLWDDSQAADDESTDEQPGDDTEADDKN